MNLAVADLFTLNIYGLQGSLVTSLAHGLSSSGLFCSVGFIQDRTDNRNLFTLAFINSFNMYPVFSTSLFLLILGTTSFPGTLNFIGELFNMISLSIVDVVFNGLFVTSIPLTTSYSLFLFKRSCGNIYLNYRNQTMDVSRLYLWIPSAALFPLTDCKWVTIPQVADINVIHGSLGRQFTNEEWIFTIDRPSHWLGYLVLYYRTGSKMVIQSIYGFYL